MGRSITSNSMIANHMNAYFILKIAAIITYFIPVSYAKLIFLKNLIKKHQSSFNLPFISTDETEDVIKKSKNSSLREFENTKMKIIKLNPKAFALFITIAINSAIAAGIFPENIKVAKFLPLLKPGKYKINPTLTGGGA